MMLGQLGMLFRSSAFVLCARLLAPLSVLADTITYYHNDLLGSPVAATNQSGQVILAPRSATSSP